MKKLAVLLLLVTVLSSLFSCGPRRYKCGPYRRCEVKEMNQPVKTAPQIKIQTGLC